MTLVELKRPLKLSDLEAGKIFDGDEIIIGSDRNSMRTIYWMSGMSNGKEFDIRMNMYDLQADSKGSVLHVNYNGNMEIYNDDPEFKEYSEKLNKSGLFPIE